MKFPIASNRLHWLFMEQQLMINVKQILWSYLSSLISRQLPIVTTEHYVTGSNVSLLP